MVWISYVCYQLVCEPPCTGAILNLLCLFQLQCMCYPGEHWLVCEEIGTFFYPQKQRRFPSSWRIGMKSQAYSGTGKLFLVIYIYCMLNFFFWAAGFFSFFRFFWDIVFLWATSSCGLVTTCSFLIRIISLWHQGRGYQWDLSSTGTGMSQLFCPPGLVQWSENLHPFSLALLCILGTCNSTSSTLGPWTGCPAPLLSLGTPSISNTVKWKHNTSLRGRTAFRLGGFSTIYNLHGPGSSTEVFKMNMKI